MQVSANNERLAQPLCLRLPSSLESMLYLLHSCCSELTVLVAGMRSRSISKAPATAAMVLPKASMRLLTSAARPFLNLEKAVLLALASFLLRCHLRKSEGTAEILENASNASGTVSILRASRPAGHNDKYSLTSTQALKLKGN